jgi:hypothetical protein
MLVIVILLDSTVHGLECNTKLDTGLGGSKKWKNLHLESSEELRICSPEFEEIEAVVNAAWEGKESNPLATLWHWAARCNKPWPISQFLNDSIACCN